MASWIRIGSAFKFKAGSRSLYNEYRYKSETLILSTVPVLQVGRYQYLSQGIEFPAIFFISIDSSSMITADHRFYSTATILQEHLP